MRIDENVVVYANWVIGDDDMSGLNEISNFIGLIWYTNVLLLNLVLIL